MYIKQIFPFYLMFTICLALMYVMQSHLLFNCDVSWLMLAARRWLAGGMYSTHFFETNPPLILFIYSPPVIVSYLFSLDIVPLARLYISGLALFSFAVTYPLIKTLFKANVLLRHGFTFLVLCVYLCVPLSEFGQREHLIILFCLPYFLSIVFHLRDVTLTKRQAVLIGIMAGLGFSIKPFYLITFIAIELYLAFKKKNLASCLRLETYSMALLMLIYALVVLAFFQDYLYFMIPMVSKYYYLGYAFGFKKVALSGFSYFALLFLAIFMVRKPHANSDLITILLIAYLTFFAVYLGQMSYTYYKRIPVISIWILLLGLQLQQFLEEANSGELNFNFLVLVAMLLIALYSFYNGVWISIMDYTSLFLYFGIIAFYIIYFIRRQEPMGLLKSLASAGLVMGGGIISANFFSLDVFRAHHFILTVTCVWLFFAAILPGRLPAKKDFNLIFVLSVLLFAYLVSYMNLYFVSQEHNAAVRNEVVKFLESNANHKPVYVFSTETFYTFPGLDYAKLPNASRFPFFWMLPGMIKGEHNPKLRTQIQQDKKLLIDMIAADISRNKPELILVDINYKFMPPSDFNYIDYFFNNPIMQPIWRHYTYWQTIKEDNFFNFQIYRRLPDNYAAK